MKNKYDAVFYDFDGTLVDTIPLITESFKLCYEKVFGVCKRPYDDFLGNIGKPLEKAFEMHDKATAKLLFDTYLEINEKLLREDKAPLFPYIKEDLMYLKSLGIPQGIVTSKMRSSVEVTMKLQGMEDIFDIVVTKEDSKKHKPDAEPILTACGMLGIKDPHRVIYVGDALPDKMCADNAGSKFALVDWTKMPRDEMTSDAQTVVLKRLNELSCIIKEGEL